MKPSEILNQWSTWRGLAIAIASACGAPAAAVAAGGHLLALVPSVVTAAVGLYDIIRDENKGKEQGGAPSKTAVKKGASA
ncbi:MAG: hypothetical protein CENE_03286 [Candidatus Celerinatantimonas neptuna]|nr:MAG: hypothetical protein CENE_03286 [Candidatus Celerinatantimonas neptuna]